MSDIAIGRKEARVATSTAFITLLLGVSVLPAICFALAAPPGGTSLSLFQILAVINIPHVALTAIFWIDPRYRGHMAANAGRYYVLPLCIVAISVVLAAAFGVAGAMLVLAAHAAWLLYHYGRQNWGLLCLAGIATKSGKPLALERFSCTWAPIAGIAVYLPSLTYLPPSAYTPDLSAVAWLPSVSAAMWSAGLALTAAVVSASAVALVRLARAGAHPLRLGMSAMAALFFVPFFLISDPGLALLLVATPHGLQYAVMTVTLAVDGRRQPVALRLALLVPLVVAGTYLMVLMLGSASPVVVCANAALIMGFHFLLDAGVWRLREPFQRAAMQESFAFLFR